MLSGFEFTTQQEGFEKAVNTINTATSGKVGITALRTFSTAKGKNIVAECKNEDKRTIMQMKKKLEVIGSDGNPKPIFVNDDLTYEDRRTQATLVDLAKQKRLAGHDVRVGKGSVKVDGEWMQINSSTGQLEIRHFRKQRNENVDLELSGTERKSATNKKLPQ